MGKFESFKLALWNPQTRKCLGRTGDSWLKLIAFYIALYSCLAAIWSLYYSIFHLTISDKYPKWRLDESIIGTNPGLGMRPSSPRERVESALIKYREGLDGDFKHWVDDLQLFIERTNLNNAPSASARNNSDGSGAGGSQQLKEDCSPDKSSENIDSFCPFDNSSIPAECSAAQNYSFPIGKPCILIKLNRIYGWRPEPYTERPANFPEGAAFTSGSIQITCEGQHDADKEHVGPIEYFPPSGIETKYYPFYNQPGYQSPYVMVHFKEPKLNTLIYVECKAWAKNIEHDRYNKRE